MRTSEMFPSKYIAEGDLGGKAMVLIMRSVEFDEVGQQKERKPILFFEKAQKGLVLNKTNMRKIESIYGNDTDDWMGHPIELYPSETDFQGETVPCIRVRAPKVNAAAKPPVKTFGSEQRNYDDRNPPPPTAADVLNDDIPF